LHKKDIDISPMKFADIGSKSDEGGIGRAYSSWKNARHRCLLPSNKDFPAWGGRGIKFCERWLNFDRFLEDMGPRPRDTTLDRIDVNGHYELTNCRWAPHSVQRMNTRVNIGSIAEKGSVAEGDQEQDSRQEDKRTLNSVTLNHRIPSKYAEIRTRPDEGGIGRAFRSWEGARTRCLLPSNKDFPKWGGRGIKFCERWLSFDNFLQDMGPRPEATTLDRIDVNGHYKPENCKWATRSTQQRNKRTSISIMHNGRKKHINEWAADIGISPQTIASRLRKQYSLEAVLSSGKYEAVKAVREDYLHFVGLTFGGLTVIDVIEVQEGEFKRFDFQCKCNCGTDKNYRIGNVIHGKAKSCGCRASKHPNPKLIRPDQQFGKWTVLVVFSRTDRRGIRRIICLCRCSCGAERKVDGHTLVAGKSTSCGHDVGVVHGACSKHSQCSKEYQVWESMKGRCYTPSAKGYQSNGARGIKVCERWAQSFENFLADMGMRPTGTLLCRKDNFKDYTPENCFWGSKRDLPPNSRARFITHNGETLTLTEWSRKLGIHINTLRKRFDRHGSLFLKGE